MKAQRRIAKERKMWSFLLLSLACLPGPAHQREQLITDLAEARAFLAEYDQRAARVGNAATLASWAFSTNVTAYNQQKKVGLSRPQAECEQVR